MLILSARPAAIVAALLTASALLLGQETRGSLAGRVTDPSGAVIPGVTVEATNVATNVSTSTKTTAEGLYVIPYLLPGTYRLRAEMGGFKTFERSDISLRISETIQIRIPMELGDTSEKMTVTAENPLVESATATLGTIADDRRLAQLPTAHGVTYKMMALNPGVIYAVDPHYDRPYEQNFIARYTMDGVPAGRSEITLDGSPNISISNWDARNIMAGYSPPADLVQELKVQPVTYDASVGHSQGGITVVTLKSGGNLPHGTAMWSGGNPALNANLFFANSAGQPRPDFEYNRWGGTFTGPVYIPKVFDGRNRVFITYGYEGIHETRPRGNVLTTPTAVERQGDFSSLLKIGTNYQIFDPATRVALPNGRYSVQPFPNNIIPSNRINPIATNILSYWPLPNIAGNPDGTSNLDRTNEPENALYWNHIFRADFNVNSKDRFFVRGNTYHRDSHDSQVFHSAASGCCHGYWTQQAMAMDNVYTINATTILDTRAGFLRHPITVDAPESGVGFDVASLGFPSSFANAVQPPQARRFPQVNITGYMAPNNASYSYPNQNASAEGILTMIRGKHTMKAGGDFRDFRNFAYMFGNTVTGQFDFATRWTQGPFDNSPASPIGQGLAALLLGLPTGGQVNRNASWAEQSTIYSAFFHDDWRITTRLTLNLGVRYELEGPDTERYNRSIRGFDFNTSSPLNAQVKANYALNPIPEIPVSQFQVMGGLQFAGVNGQPRTLWNRQWNNVMPRIGFAFQLRARTVVRGGYGIFYGPLGIARADVNQTGFSSNTQLVPSLDNGLTFIADLANPYPGGINPPRGAADGLTTFVGKGIGFFNSNPQAPRQQRWSMGIQHELPQRVLFEATYVGNHGSRLELNHDYQSLPLQYLSRSPFRDQANINLLTQQVSNPFYPLLPGTGLAGQTISRAALLQGGDYSQFTGMTSTEFDGYSWYHSLQVRAERRFVSGWTITGAYSWSKYMEAMSRLNGQSSPLEYVVADQDRPHRLVMSGIWEVPFGKGRHFFANSPRAVNAIVSGWQMEGIYTAQSGQPFGFGNALFVGDIHDIKLPRDQRTADHWFNTAGFVSNSAQQLQFNYRTLPTRFNDIRSGGVNNWDLSGIKNAKIREALRVELRWEMINAFNHPVFAAPVTAPTNQSFGHVLAQLGYARRIQFGLKLMF